MTIYCFQCPECGDRQELVRTMAKIDDDVICKCGVLQKRNFVDEHRKQRFAECGSFWSSTMGVHPEQVAEERKLHPDWTINDDGRVLVEGLNDQRKKAEE